MTNPSWRLRTDKFQQSLQNFPELRLLHLRLEVSSLLGRGTSRSTIGWSQDLLQFHLQRFANRLFRDMHEGRVPKLDALVAGHVMEEGIDTHGDVDESSALGEHCFIKGEQRDSLGRTVVVGVPVTRMLLRETHPYTDILDVDLVPIQKNPWESWAGRAM
jgi:hypothetical protein